MQIVEETRDKLVVETKLIWLPYCLICGSAVPTLIFVYCVHSGWIGFDVDSLPLVFGILVVSAALKVMGVLLSRPSRLEFDREMGFMRWMRPKFLEYLDETVPLRDIKLVYCQSDESDHRRNRVIVKSSDIEASLEPQLRPIAKEKCDEVVSVVRRWLASEAPA